jgi:hypothetical protein
MVTPIKQINKNSCTLACIESLARDKGQPKTQQAIIDQFPHWCHKGELRNGDINNPRDGEIHPLTFSWIMKDLMLAKTFAVGTGNDFLENHKLQIPDGIFLFTINHPNGVFEGYHCYRLVDVQAGLGVFMDPLSGTLFKMAWSDFDIFECVAYVCIPP